MINLHVHSSASDGLGTLSAMINRARKLNQNALAITDHGTILNWLPFRKLAKERGIKPILGVEAYYASEPDSKKFQHITLLAKNKEGFENIIKLENLGHSSRYHKPAITPEQLVSYSTGTILLTGCESSPLLSDSHNTKDEFIQAIKRFNGDVYVEIMPGIMSVDDIKRLIHIAEYLKLPIVFTSDVHYTKSNLAWLHNKINKIRYGYTFQNDGLYLKSSEEMMADALAAGIPSQLAVNGITNTDVIARSVERYVINYNIKLPVKDDDVIKLRDDLDNALAEYTSDMDFEQFGKYRERMVYELKVIEDKNFLPYFWMVREITNFAKDNKIAMGPGRGSAAGSLITFLLGITKIDPIKYGLIFERFLNPERNSYPDIDQDIETARRQEVIEFANTSWNAVPIFTTLYWQHKSLTHDLCKMFEIPYETRIKAAASQYSIEHKELMKDREYATAYNVVLGQIRHRGQHASGFAITSGLLPMERMKGGALGCPIGEGIHGSHLNEMGLVKFDLLGLSSLSSLAKMKKIAGVEPAPFGEDEKTLQLFNDGNVAGVFQFSSSGMKDLVSKIKVKSGKDIAACIALYRPGTLDVGADKRYIAHDAPSYHPEIDALLAETNGVLLYQETVMKLFQLVAGVGMGEADELRKLVAKKRVDDPMWKNLETKFIIGGIRMGLTEKAARKLWGQIVAHSNYSFNYSHAVSYAHISWEMAWYKAHHPAAFYAAVMTYDNKNHAQYIYEMVINGIKILPPDINSSTSFEYEVDANNNVRFPLTSVVGIGQTSAKYIENERSNGKFTSCKDFVERLPKRIASLRVKRPLYMLGAFDGFDDTEELGLSLAELTTNRTDIRSLEKKYLGMALPTAQLIKAINNYNTPNNAAIGIVFDVKKKQREDGSVLTVINLHNGAAYFTYLPVEVDEGDVVYITLKPYTRTIKEIRILQ